MNTFDGSSPEQTSIQIAPGRRVNWFAVTKRAFDIVVSLLLIPVLLCGVLMLLPLNMAFNRGPLFFVQPRMGRNCRVFNVIKFRTMAPGAGVLRKFDDPLDVERITALGSVLRRSRFDEVPQILNVLRGEMSFIGPRPDSYEHAAVYLKTVPGYQRRHDVRPGISGFAQVTLGYVDDPEGVHRKVMADLRYIATSGVRQELWIIWQTLRVIMSLGGK